LVPAHHDLLRAIPGISERMLSRTLAQLHRARFDTASAR
jgi:DNA-binding HxlR family transcriptional regulator